jgi:hypothetical protein
MKNGYDYVVVGGGSGGPKSGSAKRSFMRPRMRINSLFAWPQDSDGESGGANSTPSRL